MSENSVKYQYQWEKFIKNNKPKKDISKWNSSFGPLVLERKKGIATKVKFQVLVDNPEKRIFLVGKFNNWGELCCLDDYKLQHDKNSVFASVDIDTTKIKISHKEAYKFMIVDSDGVSEFLQDPAGVYFDDVGNSVFWDYDDPSTYKQKYPLINTIERSTKIMQTDLPGLIVHFADKKGKLGSEVKEKDFYKFIRESGILMHVKELGFNTIQFLPFAQSIDGDNWKYRYLVPFQFAIQKNWGTPDEFAMMIDEAHKQGLAIIGDFVIGHLPHKDYDLFGLGWKHNGIHQWRNRYGTRVYMKEETPWGTMRIDYDNEYVRSFIISSCLHFMKQYRIDGYRIDNVDGIIRYGDHGDGDERPSGRVFLRELNKALYDYNPFALIHFEAHYFHDDNAKMLVVPFEEDNRALGATAYNSSRITYYLHSYYMPKDVKKVSPWKIRDITEEKEWGQSNSTIADFHNHDAAAGLMENRCTGSYAYDTMTVKQPENHFHAIGKIKAMEAVISFMCEGRTLDLIQTFLIQTGTFEHDSSIQWYLAYNQCNNNMVEFKKKINSIMDDPAFWPMFTKNRKFLNVDDKNKVIVVERSAEYKKKKSKFIILTNLSAWSFYDYKVGLDDKCDYEVVFNSDLFDYAGTGLVSYPKVLENKGSHSFELLNREVELSRIAPYGVVVLKRVEKKKEK